MLAMLTLCSLSFSILSVDASVVLLGGEDISDEGVVDDVVIFRHSRVVFTSFASCN
jgi:hypothetical protein